MKIIIEIKDKTAKVDFEVEGKNQLWTSLNSEQQNMVLDVLQGMQSMFSRVLQS